MIDTNIPQIDVNELMARVRAEASRIADGAAQPQNALRPSRPSAAPARVRSLPRPPAPVAVRPVNLKRERLDELLRQARENTEGPGWAPKALRSLFRKQGGFNRRVMEAISSLTKTMSEVANRLRDIGPAVEAQGRWLQTFAERGGASNGSSDAQEHLTLLQGQLDRLGAHVVNLQEEVNALRRASTDPIRAVERQAEQLGLQINHLQLEIGKNSAETRFAQRSLEQMTSQRSGLELQIARLEERQAEDAKFLKAIVAEHAALLQRFASEGVAPPRA